MSSLFSSIIIHSILSYSTSLKSPVFFLFFYLANFSFLCKFIFPTKLFSIFFLWKALCLIYIICLPWKSISFLVFVFFILWKQSSILLFSYTPSLQIHHVYLSYFKDPSSPSLIPFLHIPYFENLHHSYFIFSILLLFQINSSPFS